MRKDPTVKAASKAHFLALFACFVVVLSGSIFAQAQDAAPSEDPQTAIERLTKENAALKVQIETLKQSLLRKSSGDQMQQQMQSAQDIRRKRDEMKTKGLDPDAPMSEDVLSEFDGDEAGAAQKYSGKGVFKLQGLISGFDFGMGNESGLILLSQSQAHKVVFRYEREQIRSLNPPALPGRSDPYTSFRVVVPPHYDAAKTAIVKDIDARRDTGQPTNIVTKTVLTTGDVLSANVQFDKVQEGIVVFVVQ